MYFVVQFSTLILKRLLIFPLLSTEVLVPLRKVMQAQMECEKAAFGKSVEIYVLNVEFEDLSFGFGFWIEDY